MKQELSKMSNTQLRQYLSEHRQDEKAFSQALEILISRKKSPFEYPPVSQMNYQEVEQMLQAKLKN